MDVFRTCLWESRSAEEKHVYGRETRLKYRVANLNALLKFEMDYGVLFMLILGSGKGDLL